MKTAQEMVDYCRINKTDWDATSKSWKLKHFGIIENNLTADEKVLIAFLGYFENQDTAGGFMGNFAYGVTNKRIIMAQKKIIGEQLVSVKLENINDITMKKGLMYGSILIDTIKEKFSVRVFKGSAATIHKLLNDYLHNPESYTQRERLEFKTFDEMKNDFNAIDYAADETPIIEPIQDNVGSADEIRKFKELYDEGIITKEEFDAKKKQILGI